MKLFCLVAIGANASVWIHPQVAAKLRAERNDLQDKWPDWAPGKCLWDCSVLYVQDEIECYKQFEEGTVEHAECMKPVDEAFDACVRVDGCIQADGTCGKRCLPLAEDYWKQCDEDYANGLLTDIEL